MLPRRGLPVFPLVPFPPLTGVGGPVSMRFALPRQVRHCNFQGPPRVSHALRTVNGRSMMDGVANGKAGSERLDAFARRLSQHFSLSAGDESVLAALSRNAARVPKGRVLKRYHEPESDALLVLGGMAVRSRTSADGERCVVGFLLPGELSVTCRGGEGRANYELHALVASEVALIPRQRLHALELRHPRLTEFIGWSAQGEINALQDRLVSICLGTVEDRIMHLLTDLYRRMAAIGEAGNGRVTLPIRQYDIANAVGATSVHVCKTLARMAQEGRLQHRRAGPALEFVLPELAFDDVARRHSFAGLALARTQG